MHRAKTKPLKGSLVHGLLSLGPSWLAAAAPLGGTNDPASLDRLYDVMSPGPVGLWPLAPGWYVVLGLLAVFGCAGLVRLAIRHQQNAYRRAALAELQKATTMLEVATVLKRTALAAHAHTEVASLSGTAWVRWLESTGGTAAPATVSAALEEGVYGAPGSSDHSTVSAVSKFAADWIRRHQVLEEDTEI